LVARWGWVRERINSDSDENDGKMMITVDVVMMTLRAKHTKITNRISSSLCWYSIRPVITSMLSEITTKIRKKERKNWYWIGEKNAMKDNPFAIQHHSQPTQSKIKNSLKILNINHIEHTYHAGDRRVDPIQWESALSATPMSWMRGATAALRCPPGDPISHASMPGTLDWQSHQINDNNTNEKDKHEKTNMRRQT
jgi:hypothetical protein